MRALIQWLTSSAATASAIDSNASRIAPASPPGTCVKRVDRQRQRAGFAGNVADEGHGRAEFAEAAREAQHAAGDDPRRGKRQRDRREHPPWPRTERGAACSRRASIMRKARRIGCTINGNAITAEASAAPFQVKAITMPNCACSQCPSRPLRAEQQQQQVARHHRRQHHRQLHQRVDEETSRKMPPLQPPRQRDGRRQADHGGAQRDLGREPQCLRFLRRQPHGCQSFSTVKPWRRKIAAACGRAQVAKERLRFRPRIGDQRERIDDRRVRRRWERRNGLDPAADAGIGRIHDAGAAFAALDERQGGAHVVGADDAPLQRWPPAQFLQALLAHRCRPGPRRAHPCTACRRRRPRWGTRAPCAP